MQYTILGINGPKVSRIGLGTWHTLAQTVDKKESSRCIATALDLGINFFDTADVYGKGAAEQFLGESLKNFPRDKLVIATKCFFPMSNTCKGLSRKHIFESVDNSLKNLQTDYLDLMQCHRFDPETPLQETVTAMNDLIRIGKIRHWGVSRWTAGQVDEAIAISQSQSGWNPVSNQCPYNIINNGIEADLLEPTKQNGLSIIAYSPLAQGVLTGKYSLPTHPPMGSRAADPSLQTGMWDYSPEKLEKVGNLSPIAREMGATLSQMALAWCLRKPIVASAIIGASRSEQIIENSRAVNFQLTDGQIEQIEVNMDRVNAQ